MKCDVNACLYAGERLETPRLPPQSRLFFLPEAHIALHQAVRPELQISLPGGKPAFSATHIAAPPGIFPLLPPSWASAMAPLSTTSCSSSVGASCLSGRSPSPGALVWLAHCLVCGTLSHQQEMSSVGVGSQETASSVEQCTKTGGRLTSMREDDVWLFPGPSAFGKPPHMLPSDGGSKHAAGSQANHRQVRQRLLQGLVLEGHVHQSTVCTRWQAQWGHHFEHLSAPAPSMSPPHTPTGPPSPPLALELASRQLKWAAMSRKPWPHNLDSHPPTVYPPPSPAHPPTHSRLNLS